MAVSKALFEMVVGRVGNMLVTGILQRVIGEYIY